MPGHHYPSIDARGRSQVHNGDQHVHISEPRGPLFFLGNHQVDLENLSSELRATATECKRLQRCLRTSTDSRSSSSKERSVTSSDDSNADAMDIALSNDVDELESLVETLCFHVGEDDFRSGEGWQRPLSELNETLSTYRDRLRGIRTSIGGYNGGKPMREDQLQDARSSIRDMRLKFSISIALVTYCSFQTSQATQVGHLQALDERLRAVLEQIENDKATRLPPGQPLASTIIADVESAKSLLLRRHLEGSLEDDRETIRAASMQVSSFVASTNAEPAEEEYDGITTTRFGLHTAENDRRDWVMITLVDGTESFFKEYHCCKILLNMGQTVEQLKIELLKMYGSIMRKRWKPESTERNMTTAVHRTQPNFSRKPVLVVNSKSHGAPRKQDSHGQLRTTDLALFYGFVRLNDKWRLQDYTYNSCVPQVVCFFADARLFGGAKAGDPDCPVNLRILRKIVSRRNDFEMDGFYYHPAKVASLDASISTDNHRAKALLAQALAWTTVGMTYDASRGKYTALEAYENASSTLWALATDLRQTHILEVNELQKAFAAQIEHLHTYTCRIGRLVTCSKDNTNDGNFQEGELVTVLAVVEELNTMKVMKPDEKTSLLEAAWDLQAGWIRYETV